MGQGKSKKQRVEQRIGELELKKRSGLVRVAFAVVLMVVLIVGKISLTNSGVAWADTTYASLAIFIAALVLAGVAGMGSRAWAKANDELKALRAKQR